LKPLDLDRGNPGVHADQRGLFDAELGGDLACWFASDSPLEEAVMSELVSAEISLLAGN
jgi:hypothetical protein